jgi:hypothetical protein
MTIARVFAAVGMPSPRHLCELEQVVGGADHRPLASDLFEELTEPSDARDLAEDWFRELLPEAVLFSKYLETRIRAGVSHDARCRRYTPRVTDSRCATPRPIAPTRKDCFAQLCAVVGRAERIRACGDHASPRRVLPCDQSPNGRMCGRTREHLRQLGHAALYGGFAALRLVRRLRRTSTILRVMLSRGGDTMRACTPEAVAPL